MAERSSRAPVLMLVAVAVSVPGLVAAGLGEELVPYEWMKLLHILGAVLFLGNLVVTAGWMAWAVSRREAAVVAFAAATVNKADRWFTSPGVILLLLNGFAMTALAYGGWLGFTTTGWILAGLVLLIATFVVFAVAVRRYQIGMVRLSSDAAESGTALSEEFFATFRKWALWGTFATILPLIALYFMVAKPVI